MRPLRRLDDPTTYFGLSILNWLQLSLVLGVLYVLVAVVHMPFRPVITLTLMLGGAGAVFAGQSARQALGPLRYLRALIAQRRHRRRPIAHVPGEQLTGFVRLRDVPPIEVPQFEGWDPHAAAEAHLADLEA